jgi:Insulinase (Peptidase family M16)
MSLNGRLARRRFNTSIAPLPALRKSPHARLPRIPTTCLHSCTASYSSRPCVAIAHRSRHLTSPASLDLQLARHLGRTRSVIAAGSHRKAPESRAPFSSFVSRALGAALTANHKRAIGIAVTSLTTATVFCSLQPSPRPYSTSAKMPTLQRAVPTTSKIVAENMEKPSLDDRSYRVIRLPNELEALLIHDPETDKASAALDVNAGNYSDPDDLPGLAHAVEHLLFLGTEKVGG